MSDHYIRLPALTLTIALTWISACAADLLVFYGYPGTVHNFENPTSIAIEYEYDGTTPLNEALIRFFNGPSETETNVTGATQGIECVKNIVDDSPIHQCGADEIFSSVNLVNGTAVIELNGVPSAPTSGQWIAFLTPLRLTVSQFPGVSDFKLIVMGKEVTGLDWGFGCNSICFRFPETAKELDEMLKDQF